MFEVELKYAIADPATIRQQVLDRGGAAVGSQQHADTYFAHPCRDFSETTEALRIRQIDSRAKITYKGPKQPGIAKIRQELEWSLGPDDQDGEKLSTVLVALGFQPVASVKKSRETLAISHQGLDLEVTLDEVAEVGWYTEIEAIAASQSEIEAARQAITGLAGELGLRDVEPRSYLSLLLDQRKTRRTD